MTAVVYTRVPETLKQALDSYAGEQGISVNAATIGLIEHGLEHDQTQDELERQRTRLTQTEQALQTARTREQTSRRLHRSLAEKAAQPIGSCPHCRKPITGYDLLATSSCPHCQKPLSSYLPPAPRPWLDQPGYLTLIGALSLLLIHAHQPEQDS